MLNANVVPAVLGGLVVLVAGTGTAVATTGTFVHLTDATSGVPARVDGEGRLAVGDEEGPLTVDVAGRVPVHGTVSVSNRPVVIPAEVPWSSTVRAHKTSGDKYACTGPYWGSKPLREVPEGYRVRLTSVDLAVSAGNPAVISAWVDWTVIEPNGGTYTVPQGVPLSRSNQAGHLGGRVETDMVLSEEAGDGEARRAESRACVEGPTDKLVHMVAVYTGTLVPDDPRLQLPLD